MPDFPSLNLTPPMGGGGAASINPAAMLQVALQAQQVDRQLREQQQMGEILTGIAPALQSGDPNVIAARLGAIGPMDSQGRPWEHLPAQQLANYSQMAGERAQAQRVAPRLKDVLTSVQSFLQPAPVTQGPPTGAPPVREPDSRGILPPSPQGEGVIGGGPVTAGSRGGVPFSEVRQPGPPTFPPERPGQRARNDATGEEFVAGPSGWTPVGPPQEAATNPREGVGVPLQQGPGRVIEMRTPRSIGEMYDKAFSLSAETGMPVSKILDPTFFANAAEGERQLALQTHLAGLKPPTLDQIRMRAFGLPSGHPTLDAMANIPPGSPEAKDLYNREVVAQVMTKVASDAKMLALEPKQRVAFAMPALRSLMLPGGNWQPSTEELTVQAQGGGGSGSKPFDPSDKGAIEGFAKGEGNPDPYDTNRTLDASDASRIKAAQNIKGGLASQARAQSYAEGAGGAAGRLGVERTTPAVSKPEQFIDLRSGGMPSGLASDQLEAMANDPNSTIARVPDAQGRAVVEKGMAAISALPRIRQLINEVFTNDPVKNTTLIKFAKQNPDTAVGAKVQELQGMILPWSENVQASIIGYRPAMPMIKSFQSLMGLDPDWHFGISGVNGNRDAMLAAIQGISSEVNSGIKARTGKMLPGGAPASAPLSTTPAGPNRPASWRDIPK